MSKKKFKKFTRKAHLYLGLASGIIVFIIALTGCCWVFHEEIESLIHPEETPIENPNHQFITPTLAKSIAADIFPDKVIHGTKYGQYTEPVEVIFYQPEPLFYQTIFLHPFTGEILKTKDNTKGFFSFVLQGHMYLWLPTHIGEHVVGYGTMTFVVLLISGIILWWPKNKKHRQQSLKFQWKPTTKWKRKNYDLHSILGFYVSVFALLISFSGLIMAFGWVYFITYKVWGGDKAPQFITPNNQELALDTSTESNTIDSLVPRIVAEYPNYTEIEVHYPHADSSSIYVQINTVKGVYYNTDYRFFDQNNGQELESNSIYGKYADASLGDKVIRMNYDIHVGAIGGLFGKILAFLSSLLVASLPVTGVLLWWGRKNKKKKEKLVLTTDEKTEKVLEMV